MKIKSATLGILVVEIVFGEILQLPPWIFGLQNPQKCRIRS